MSDIINDLLLKNSDKLPHGYDLVGVDGNAYSILAFVKNALKHSKWCPKDIESVMSEMMRSDYDNLVATACAILYTENSHDNDSEESENEF